MALADLDAHQGETVTAGGRVVAVAGDRITISDTSGTAQVLLTGLAAQANLALLPGDLLNVVGIVVAGPDGSPAIAVADPDALTRLVQLEATPAPSAPDPSATTYWPAAPLGGLSGAAAPRSSLPLVTLLIVLILAGVGLLLSLAHPGVRARLRARLSALRARIEGSPASDTR